MTPADFYKAKGSAKKAKKEEVEPKKEESESDDNVKSEEVEN